MGEGDELINSLTDIAVCAKTFVEDCSKQIKHIADEAEITASTKMLLI